MNNRVRDILGGLCVGIFIGVLILILSSGEPIVISDEAKCLRPQPDNPKLVKITENDFSDNSTVIVRYYDNKKREVEYIPGGEQ